MKKMLVSMFAVAAASLALASPSRATAIRRKT